MRDACEDFVSTPQGRECSVSATGVFELNCLDQPPSVRVGLGERCVRADEIDSVRAAAFFVEKTPIARAINFR